MTGRWRKGCWNQLGRKHVNAPPEEGQGELRAAGAAEGEPGKVAERPGCRALPSAPSGQQPQPASPPPHPPFRRNRLLPPATPPRPATAEMTRGGRRAVPGGARGRADPGCCAAAAAAAKAGGGLERRRQRRQRWQPGSSRRSLSQLAPEGSAPGSGRASQVRPGPGGGRGLLRGLAGRGDGAPRGSEVAAAAEGAPARPWLLDAPLGPGLPSLPSRDGVCTPGSGAGAGAGPRPPAQSSRVGRGPLPERLPESLGASLGKGTAAFPRSRSRPPPWPGRRPSAAWLWRLRQPKMLRTPCPRGGWAELNPFAARGMILESPSGWFLIFGLAVKPAQWGRGKTYRSPRQTAMEPGKGVFISLYSHGMPLPL
ncbi:translation initiation factor IF-2-like [Cervus canadensis]|uniref:translation initiation factor IF-2-like n=1 Tax=Cervus canadensis TaxID=1574408 RepID=UPI001CA3111F|nr:translation initiation factor IF-2-like [Cervus canadensis]